VGFCGCDFLQPPDTKAATARVTNTERIIFLMVLPFQKVFRTIYSAKCSSVLTALEHPRKQRGK